MTVNITARRVAIWTITIVLVLLGFQFLWLIRNVIFLIFLSILLATGIEPVVNWLRRGPFNRGMGILFVYTILFSAIALIIYLTFPPLIDEGRNLVANFTNPDKIKEAIANFDSAFIRDIATTVYQNAGALLQGASLQPAANSALTVGLTVFETLFSSITVFVIAFYWLTERTLIKRFIFSFVPDDKKTSAREIWNGVEEKLGAWVRGQLLLMLFIGALAGVGYTIMGLKFALALAVFAGLTEIIPLVGPYLGGAPAVLVALTQNVTLAIVVVVYIVILQLVEGNLLVPRIMKSAVGVSPLTVIVGILIGSTLAGVGGALIAVPIAATIQVIFNSVLSFGSNATPQDKAIEGSLDTGKALQVAASAREGKADSPSTLA